MKESTNERLGANIREIRKQKGFTQQYIAEKVGTTKQAICKIEKHGSANQTTIERIAKALFVDVKELYEPIEKRQPLYETVDFISVEEKELTLHQHLYPLYKELNDIVASRYARMIKEQCHLTVDDIEQLLKKKGYNKSSYSPQELYEICVGMNNEYIIKVYDILNGVANKETKKEDY